MRTAFKLAGLLGEYFVPRLIRAISLVVILHAAIGGLVPLSASAEPVTFVAKGIVNSVNDRANVLPSFLSMPFGAGTPVTATITFDTTVPDRVSDNFAGDYLPSSVVITVGENPPITIDPALRPEANKIFIGTGAPAGGPYTFSTFSVYATKSDCVDCPGHPGFQLTFSGGPATYFATDALPTTPPDVAQFPEKTFVIGFCPDYINCGGLIIGDMSLTLGGVSPLPTSFQYPVGPDGWNKRVHGFGSLNLKLKKGERGERDPYAPHLGQDWNINSGNDKGKPVVAVADGKVLAINYDCNETPLPTNAPTGTTCENTGGWGVTILVEHAAPPGQYFLTGSGKVVDKVYANYAHLLPSNDKEYKPAMNIQAGIGQQIKKGDPVGQVGKPSGGADHLHFEIFLQADPGTYRQTAGYSWDLTHHTDPSEFIDNNLGVRPLIDVPIQ